MAEISDLFLDFLRDRKFRYPSTFLLPSNELKYLHVLFAAIDMQLLSQLHPQNVSDSKKLSGNKMKHQQP